MAVMTQYETDFAQWATETADALRSGHLSELDIEHIAEEIGDLAGKDRREVGRRLMRLIQHLLKWQFQSANRSQSGLRTIHDQRDELARLFEQSPSLRQYGQECLVKEYPRARKRAMEETFLPVNAFPDRCPWSFEQLLDEDFLPAAASL